MEAGMKDKAPLIIAAVLVLAAIVMYAKQSPNVSSGAQVLAPNNSSTDAANAQIAAANASSAQQYDQLITQEFGSMVGFGTQIQNNLTSEQLATIQAQRDEQIAAYQAQVQQTMYNDQLQAIKTQSNNQAKSSIFGSLFGAVASIFGL